MNDPPAVLAGRLTTGVPLLKVAAAAVPTANPAPRRNRSAIRSQSTRYPTTMAMAREARLTHKAQRGRGEHHERGVTHRRRQGCDDGTEGYAAAEVERHPENGPAAAGSQPQQRTNQGLKAPRPLNARYRPTLLPIIQILEQQQHGPNKNTHLHKGVCRAAEDRFPDAPRRHRIPLSLAGAAPTRLRPECCLRFVLQHLAQLQ